MTPEEQVALVDFRYITDVLTPEAALARLERLAPTRAEREAELRRDGYPAYTTSVGWLGYPDDKVRRLCREALAEGWTRFKMKVGADVTDDLRRGRIIRDEIGPGPDARGRRQPALGRRRGDRLDARARAARPVLDRGADQPRRHPRARRDRPGGGPDPGRHRRARPQPGDVQAAAPGRGDRRLPGRRLPARWGQRGPRRAADGGQVRRARSARTPAVSGCASSSSISRSSTTSASAGRSRAG